MPKIVPNNIDISAIKRVCCVRVNDIYQRSHKAIGLPAYYSNWINHYCDAHGAWLWCEDEYSNHSNYTFCTCAHDACISSGCTAWNSTLWYSVPVPLSLHFLLFSLLHGSKTFNRAVALLKGSVSKYVSVGLAMHKVFSVQY